MSIKKYPWLFEAAARLPQALPAALMLYGQNGIGKSLLAEALSQSVLCRNAAGPAQPCGQCDDCHLFAVGNHPDFRKLQPEVEEEGEQPEAGRGGKRPGTRISVDMVRGLTDLLAVAPHRGGARVVLIIPAESMNTNAANALLKMLEEPSTRTHFVLVTHERNRVLATVKSRCFQLPVPAPQAEIARIWLQQQGLKRAEKALPLSSYAPLAAQALSDDEAFWEERTRLMEGLTNQRVDPLQLAHTAEKLEPARVARILGMCVYDLLAVQSGGKVRYNTDLDKDLERVARVINAKDLCRWSDDVRAFAKAVDHPLNRKLALETLFVSWPGARQIAS